MTHDTSNEVIWQGNWREATPEEQIARLKDKIAELERHVELTDKHRCELIELGAERGAREMAEIAGDKLWESVVGGKESLVESLMQLWRERRREK